MVKFLRVKKIIALTLIFIIGVLGCSEVDFLRNPPPPSSLEQDRFYEYKPNRSHFLQNEYEHNKVSFSFKVFDERGQTLNDLDKRSLKITENGQNIEFFNLISNVIELDRSVDIVFILDITGSMKEEVNFIKNHISDFVESLIQRNIKANLCLVTFKDSVKRRCESFHEDDPRTAVNENLKKFKKDISKIRASGGGSEKENSLGGIISAASDTPWHPNSQRLAVLVTDAPFHDGGGGFRKKPTYGRTIDVLNSKKVTLFAVAPDLPGYSSSYNGLPALVDINFGTFFDFARIELEGFTAVFDQLLSQLSTEFMAEYFIEENLLDPQLPLSDREINFSIENIEDQRVERFPPVATLPEGRPLYKKEWVIERGSEIEIIGVKLNDEYISRGFRIKNGKIIFERTPDPGSHIEVIYEEGGLGEHIDIKPYVVDWTYPDFEITLHLNGQTLSEGDYRYTYVDNKLTVTLEPHLFSNEDRFNVRERGRLHLKVSLKSIDSLGEEEEDGDDSED